MIDKVLLLVGILLAAILVIENIVSGMIGYLFLDTGANAGLVVFFAILVGIMIGVGLRGFLGSDNNKNEDDYDF